MLTKNRVGGVLLLVFCLLYWWLIADIRLLPFQRGQAFTAQTIPRLLAILGTGLAVLCIVLPGRDGGGREGGGPDGSGGERLDLSSLDWGRVAASLGLMSVYGLTVRPAGFIIATTVFLMAGFTLLGERRVWVSALVAVPLVVGFWVLMTQGLDVYIAPWPRGW